MNNFTTYTTIQGDAFDAIAYRLWGEERLFMEIAKANPKYLDMIIFPAGIVLNIPPKPEKYVVMEMPPWM